MPIKIDTVTTWRSPIVRADMYCDYAFWIEFSRKRKVQTFFLHVWFCHKIFVHTLSMSYELKKIHYMIFAFICFVMWTWSHCQCYSRFWCDWDISITTNVKILLIKLVVSILENPFASVCLPASFRFSLFHFWFMLSNWLFIHFSLFAHLKICVLLKLWNSKEQEGMSSEVG